MPKHPGDALPHLMAAGKISAKFQNPFQIFCTDEATLPYPMEGVAMTTHRHERTAYQDRRDELIDLIGSGITAYPGSEMGYLLDMLSDDATEASAPTPLRAWSWREMFTFGAVLRLT